MQTYLKEEGIVHFVSQNEVKANYAERVIKTLKMRIMRYFSMKQTHKWTGVLGDITDSYNRTYHRTISMSPSTVNEDNEVDACMDTYLSLIHI